MLWVFQGVFHGEDAAPGVPVEHEVIEPQADTYLLDFLRVALEGPQGRVVRLIGVVAAQLVVVVHLDAGLRQK